MTDPYTRKCGGDCGDESPHDSHLTEAGKQRYSATPEPEKNLFHDAETPRAVMGMLAGYTSLCWTDKVIYEGKYGRSDVTERVFDSERASFAVDQALDRLEELGFISPADKEKL